MGMKAGPANSLQQRNSLFGTRSKVTLKHLKQSLDNVAKLQMPKKDKTIESLLKNYVRVKKEEGKSEIIQTMKCCNEFLTRQDVVGQVSKKMLLPIFKDIKEKKDSIYKKEEEIKIQLEVFNTTSKKLAEVHQNKVELYKTSNSEKDISAKEKEFNIEIKKLEVKNKSIEKNLKTLEVQLKLEVDRFKKKYDGVGNLIEEILQKME